MRAGVLGGIAGGVLAAVTLLWSCTVDRPSESLQCASQADCATGRICQSGYCIVGTLPIDAAPPDALLCPDLCNGGCDLTATPPTCTITGTGSGNVTCPAPFACNIACPTPGACGAINCGQGASCDIDCAADGACPSIACTTKNCDVTCTGANACGNLSCTTGNCARTCTGTGACGTMSCAGGACLETCSGGGACGDVSCGTGRCLATCMGSGAGGESACGFVACDNSCRCDVSCDATTNPCPSAMTCPRSVGQKYCTPSEADGDRCDSSIAPQCNDCP